LRDGEGTRTSTSSWRAFRGLYEPIGEKGDQGAIYRAKGVVLRHPLPGGLDIAAPWGSRQTASAGYLLCNGEEVYGSSREAFEATYDVVGELGWQLLANLASAAPCTLLAHSAAASTRASAPFLML